MGNQQSGGAEFFVGLVLGGLVGAALALLLAPQSGEETRAQIRDKGLEFKDRAEEGVLEARSRAEAQMTTLQEQVATLQNQVATLQERGKEQAAVLQERGKEALAKGKQAVSRGQDALPSES